MYTTTSQDGTQIAYELLGDGRRLVIVAGALQSGQTYRPLAEALAGYHTVVNYDRRGRGGSGDTAPYAVAREVEDIAALIATVGGSAAVYGHSSGAALALHAAAAGLPIDRLVLHDAPFGDGTDEERRAAREEYEHFAGLIAEDRRREAVTQWFASAGAPVEIAETAGADPAMQANAPTILYEYALLDDASRGGRSPVEQAREVSAPTLVLAGDASPPFMLDTARKLAAALRDGRLEILTGQEHVVPAEILAPIVAAHTAG